jgi:hypothetical protein
VYGTELQWDYHLGLRQWICAPNPLCALLWLYITSVAPMDYPDSRLYLTFKCAT